MHRRGEGRPDVVIVEVGPGYRQIEASNPGRHVIDGCRPTVLLGQGCGQGLLLRSKMWVHRRGRWEGRLAVRLGKQDRRTAAVSSQTDNARRIHAAAVPVLAPRFGLHVVMAQQGTRRRDGAHGRLAREICLRRHGFVPRHGARRRHAEQSKLRSPHVPITAEIMSYFFCMRRAIH